jgi:tetratricopeptide (TPR) repeat protein
VAYSKALKEHTRERAPLDWAGTQNNLGNVLWTLGTRESGTARLEQAVLAYGEALKERTREHTPLDWAETQNNLGTALRTLGERENSIERLRQAEAVIQSAYDVFKGAGYNHYNTYFEERLRSLRQLTKTY